MKKQSFSRGLLPDLIYQAIRLSPNITVLGLDINELHAHRAMDFSNLLQSTEAQHLPKVQHLMVKATPNAMSMVIDKCATLNSLVSLHLFTANQGIHWQTACGHHQARLRRLHLIIDTNVDVVGLPLHHLSRTNPTERANKFCTVIAGFLV